MQYIYMENKMFDHWQSAHSAARISLTWLEIF